MKKRLLSLWVGKIGYPPSVIVSVEKNTTFMDVIKKAGIELHPDDEVRFNASVVSLSEKVNKEGILVVIGELEVDGYFSDKTIQEYFLSRAVKAVSLVKKYITKETYRGLWRAIKQANSEMEKYNNSKKQTGG